MGEADPRILEVCREEDRALITLDMDFANVRAYPPTQHPGIVVLRVPRQDKPHVLAVFRGALPLLGQHPLQHHLWIVEEDRVRIWGEENE